MQKLLEVAQQLAHAFDDDIVTAGAQAGASGLIAALFIGFAGGDVAAGVVGQAAENGFTEGGNFTEGSTWTKAQW